MWKLIFYIVAHRKLPYTKIVEAGNELYIIHIEKYESTDAMISRMKKALDVAAPKAQ